MPFKRFLPYLQVLEVTPPMLCFVDFMFHLCHITPCPLLSDPICHSLPGLLVSPSRPACGYVRSRESNLNSMQQKGSSVFYRREFLCSTEILCQDCSGVEFLHKHCLHTEAVLTQAILIYLYQYDSLWLRPSCGHILS